MLGRKREALEPRGRGPVKRRWQKELDDDASDAEAVTAEDLEQWRRREERQRDEQLHEPPAPVAPPAPAAVSPPSEPVEAEFVGAAVAACVEGDDADAPPSPKRRKRFAWMDSDEEENGDDDADEEEEVPLTRRHPDASRSEEATAESLPSPPPPVPVPLNGVAGDCVGGGLRDPDDDRGVNGSSVAAGARGEEQDSIARPGADLPPGDVDAIAAAKAQLMMQQLQMQFQQPQPQPQPQPPPPIIRPPSAKAVPEVERFEGRIKRFTDLPGGGGYGFIDSEEAKLRYARDVYIHKNQMNGVTVGDEVCFTIVRNSKGEPQARNVMRAEDARLLWMAGGGASALASGSAAVQGSAASFSAVPPGAPAAPALPAAFTTPRHTAGAGLLTGAPALQTSSALMDEEQAKQFQASLRSARR